MAMSKAFSAFFLVGAIQVSCKDLLDLDARMTALSSKMPSLPLVGSHPIYQYMVRKYNLNLKMVIWEPDEDPGEKKWNHLHELVKEFSVKWMIWEGEPLAGQPGGWRKWMFRAKFFLLILPGRKKRTSFLSCYSML